MMRMCVTRRRRHVALAASFALIVASSLLLIGSRDSVQVTGSSDYDALYDGGDDADVARALLVRKRELVPDSAAAVVDQASHQGHSDLRVRSSLKTDRKPQGQTDYDPEEAGLYHRRVIFNKENLPVMAKRLAFVHTPQYNGKNLPEDDDDYAEGTNDDVRSNNDVIGEHDDASDEDEAEDEYEYWDNPNPVFKPGDFEDRANGTRKHPFKFQDVNNPLNRPKKNKTESSRTPLHKPRRPANTSGPGSRALQSKTFAQPSSDSSLRFSPRSHHKNKKGSNDMIHEQNEINKQKNGQDRGVPEYEQPATQLQMPALLRQPGEVNSYHGYPVVREHIYWSEEVESFVPKGKNYETMEEDMEAIRASQVRTMKEPQWNRCGRPSNQYIVMETGRALCARYRDPHNKLIYGELLSFYLSRMLGFDNIPIVVLSEVNSSAPQWRGQNFAKAQWKEGRMVALIEWIKGLDEERSRVKMPPVVLSAYEQGLTVTGQHPALSRMSKSELAELLQWGDMVILDYITGHYDRVASMQDGADREKKPSILSENIRNLRKVPETGKMWLIDNESGLLDAYELMYTDAASGDRFTKFHQRMLRTMCIFRKPLIRKVKALASHADPASVLLHFTKEFEPFYDRLPKVSAFHLFERHFHSRLKEVTKWISECMDR